jgi:hypothetical protein
MTTPGIQSALLDPEVKKVLESYSAAGVGTAADTANDVLQNSVVVDLTALRAAVVAMNAKLDVLTAKLNADAGVTDANYATNFAATLDPAALTTVAV